MEKKDICAYCGGNKYVRPEQHLAELAKFLQEKIKECQDIIKYSTSL